MYPLKQSTSIDAVFFAFDSSGDGVTGKVDGDFTKRISKNGAAFAAMTVTVSERENGFYVITLSTSHTDTLGILTVSLSASGIKRVNLQFRVHARLPDDLATQASVDVVDDFLDTEIAAIKAKTDALPADPADASDIAASFSGVNTKLDTIDDFLDTEVAAIKAKTDALPSDPADASDIAASFAAVNTKLDTIDDFLDTEIAAILADTNELQTDWANGGRLDLLIDAILADTGTDGVVVSAATANQIADAILKRDWTSVTGESARSALNALRFLRNKWSLAAGTLTVTKEDDSTSAWTAAVSTDPAAEPITASDPA